MGKDTIQARGQVNPCNPSEVTGSDIPGNKRALDVTDVVSQDLLTQIRDCLKDPQTKVADETISALRLVSAVSPTNVELGQPSGGEPRVIGVSRTSGSLGDQIEVITTGEVSDSFFNFPANTKLFLGPDGVITDVVPTAPSSDYLVRIGHSLGPGRIFLNIEAPIRLN